MIEVTRLNGTTYYLNPHLIELIENNPDTTITLFPSKKLVVKNTIDEICNMIIEYRKKIGISLSDAEIIHSSIEDSGVKA